MTKKVTVKFKLYTTKHHKQNTVTNTVQYYCSIFDWFDRSYVSFHVAKVSLTLFKVNF